MNRRYGGNSIVTRRVRRAPIFAFMPPAAEAPYEIVPAGPQLRSVAWPQVTFLVLAILAALAPLAAAFLLAV